LADPAAKSVTAPDDGPLIEPTRTFLLLAYNTFASSGAFDTFAAIRSTHLIHAFLTESIRHAHSPHFPRNAKSTLNGQTRRLPGQDAFPNGSRN
jgi:hypothetical protein